MRVSLTSDKAAVIRGHGKPRKVLITDLFPLFVDDSPALDFRDEVEERLARLGAQPAVFL